MQVQTELERYHNDALYFEQHRQGFLEQHPDHWIAVYKQQVVGVARGLPQLLKQLDKKGLPRGRVFIERLSTKEEILILYHR